jgi:DNA invertase Pin-like site-specific DNA recombinase
MRVSTEEQDHALQFDALVAAGIPKENIYQDKISGSKINRKGLEKCLKAIGDGDVLYVWKIDRLGRKLYDLVDLMRDLERRGAGFVSLTQSIDTTNPAGKMMLGMLFLFAEFERETIRERVKAGIKAVRDANPTMKWGRAREINYDRAHVESLISQGRTVREIARIAGISKSLVNKISHQMKEKKKLNL